MSRVRWSIHPALLLAVCWALLASGDAAAGERAAPNAKPKPAAASPTVAMYDLLDQPTELEFEKEAVHEVVQFLSDYHKIPVLLDENGLAEVGIGRDEPMTASRSGLSLRTATDIVLSPLDLELIPREGYLQLTSTDRGQEHPFVRVLDVTQLVEPGLSFFGGFGSSNSEPPQPGGQGFFQVGPQSPDASGDRKTQHTATEPGISPSAGSGGYSGDGYDGDGGYFGGSSVSSASGGSGGYPGDGGSGGSNQTLQNPSRSDQRNRTTTGRTSSTQPGTAAEAIIALVENGTESSVWQSNGGESTITVIESGNQTLLMVRASNRTHHEVDVLLATLRAAITTPKTKPPKSKPPGQNSESTEDAAPDKD